MIKEKGHFLLPTDSGLVQSLKEQFFGLLSSSPVILQTMKILSYN